MVSSFSILPALPIWHCESSTENTYLFYNMPAQHTQPAWCCSTCLTTIIHHYSPLLTIINHYEPLLTTNYSPCWIFETSNFWQPRLRGDPSTPQATFPAVFFRRDTSWRVTKTPNRCAEILKFVCFESPSGKRWDPNDMYRFVFLSTHWWGGKCTEFRAKPSQKSYGSSVWQILLCTIEVPVVGSNATLSQMLWISMTRTSIQDMSKDFIIYIIYTVHMQDTFLIYIYIYIHIHFMYMYVFDKYIYIYIYIYIYK